MLIRAVNGATKTAAGRELRLASAHGWIDGVLAV
jgi:hypothetical protein